MFIFAPLFHFNQVVLETLVLYKCFFIYLLCLCPCYHLHFFCRLLLFNCLYNSAIRVFCYCLLHFHWRFYYFAAAINYWLCLFIFFLHLCVFFLFFDRLKLFWRRWKLSNLCFFVPNMQHISIFESSFGNCVIISSC